MSLPEMDYPEVGDDFVPSEWLESLDSLVLDFVDDVAEGEY